MEHYVFFLMNIGILLIVYYFDRKKIKDHLILGIIAFFGAIAFEILPILLGFWTHHAEPKVWIFSVFSFLLYFPFISFSYFAANRLLSIKEG